MSNEQLPEKEWAVWIEGYMATGEHSTASLEGKAMAMTFDEACIKVCGDKLDKEGNDYRRGSFRKSMAPGIERTNAILLGGNYSIWGCQLFPTEAEARKSFG